MRARYCSPITGRFLGVDPARESGKPTQPQTWNRYSYVTSNPLKYYDPDGKERVGIQLDQDVRALQEGRISRQEFSERLQARGAGAAIGLALVGLAASAPAVQAGIAVLASRFPGAFQALQELGLGFTGGSAVTRSVSTPVAGAFERQFAQGGVNLGLLADASTRGTTLTLSNVALYSDQGKVNLGAKAVLGVLRTLGQDLKSKGYSTLVVEGVRYSGAKPGRTASITIDLDKFLK
jgi:hypothetical protein